ncbi:MAG TPA: DUF3592 domain-containing protein [Acidimicrobiales bacterium]|nr:DUF3592 domain-containing protein [Acidimicrobiales bacterium]
MRYRRSGRTWLLAGVLLMVVACIIAVRAEDRSEELARTGRHTSGVVTAVRHGGRLSEGSINVRFQAASILYEERINLNSDSPIYRVGQQVEVIYDPSNPSNVRTTAEENDSALGIFVFCVAFVASFVALPVGFTVVRRARRWRRMLRKSPWSKVSATYKELPAGRTIQPILRLGRGPDAAVGTVTSSLRGRLKSLRPVAELYIVGDLAGPAVVAPSPIGPFFEFRRSRRKRKQRRWEAAFGAQQHR